MVQSRQLHNPIHSVHLPSLRHSRYDYTYYIVQCNKMLDLHTRRLISKQVCVGDSPCDGQLFKFLQSACTRTRLTRDSTFSIAGRTAAIPLRLCMNVIMCELTVHITHVRVPLCSRSFTQATRDLIQDTVDTVRLGCGIGHLATPLTWSTLYTTTPLTTSCELDNK